MDEAKPLLAEMSHKDLTPDTVTYSTLMKGLCRGGRVLDAQKLFKEMHVFFWPASRFDCLLNFARWLVKTWTFG
jgi:pentatricopeptide repeat protein